MVLELAFPTKSSELVWSAQLLVQPPGSMSLQLTLEASKLVERLIEDVFEHGRTVLLPQADVHKIHICFGLE